MLTGAAKFVGIILQDQLAGSKRARIAIDRICELSGYSPASIKRALQELREVGAIEVFGMRGAVNTYALSANSLDANRKLVPPSTEKVSSRRAHFDEKPSSLRAQERRKKRRLSSERAKVSSEGAHFNPQVSSEGATVQHSATELKNSSNVVALDFEISRRVDERVSDPAECEAAIRRSLGSRQPGAGFMAYDGPLKFSHSDEDRETARRQLEKEERAPFEAERRREEREHRFDRDVIRERIVSIGVRGKDVEPTLDKYDAEFLVRKIEALNARNERTDLEPLANEAAWFMSSLADESDWAPPPRLQRRQKARRL